MSVLDRECEDTVPRVRGDRHGKTRNQADLLPQYAALWRTPTTSEDDDDTYTPQLPSRAPLTDFASVSPAQRNPIPRARITAQPPPPRDSSHSLSDFNSDDECTPRAQEHSATGTPSTNPRPPLSYRHTRLFRIQRLYPQLVIQLRAFSLNTMPKYVAVSHRWGQEATSSTIKCNESLLMLKPSLVACIQNTSQFLNPDTWFWVDGVCIEQNNEAEKAQQVKLLWKLFGDAECVVMYLGEGDSDSTTAIAALRECALLRQRQTSRQTLAAIRRLLHRPWFTRLWTMQEAILAQDLLVVCGEDSVKWQDVEYVYCFVKPDVHSSFGPEAINSPSVDAIISLRRWRAEDGEENAEYCTRILHLMFSQSCFLEVDRVYAVLGLFPPGLMAKVDVNYSRDHRVEYWAKYLQFCQGLLSCLGRRNGPVVDALRGIAQRAHKCPGNAPLWCPDFSRPLHEPAKEAEEWGW